VAIQVVLREVATITSRSWKCHLHRAAEIPLVVRVATQAEIQVDRTKAVAEAAVDITRTLDVAIVSVTATATAIVIVIAIAIAEATMIAVLYYKYLEPDDLRTRSSRSKQFSRRPT
jgi:hypothetical protein